MPKDASPTAPLRRGLFFEGVLSLVFKTRFFLFYVFYLRVVLP